MRLPIHKGVLQSLMDGAGFGIKSLAGSSTQEIYISSIARVDGTPGTGSKSDPFDGSTAALFDAAMRSIPEYTSVHLGPGLFLTFGGSASLPANTGWNPKNGLKLIGSGIAATYIRLVNTGVANHDVIVTPSSAAVQYCEIANLTVDCNVSAQSVTTGTCTGIGLWGTNNWIHDCSVYHYGSLDNAHSVWGMYCGASSTADSTNNLISDCILGQPDTITWGINSAGINAFSFRVAGSSTIRQSTICSCYANGIHLDGTTATAPYFMFIRIEGSEDTLIFNNHLFDVSATTDGACNGFYCNTGQNLRIVFRSNIFSKLGAHAFGVYYVNQTVTLQNSSLFDQNVFSLNDSTAQGMFFSAGSTGTMRRMTASHNTIASYGTTGKGMQFYNAQFCECYDNLITAASTHEMLFAAANCSFDKLDSNRDQNGNVIIMLDTNNGFAPHASWLATQKMRQQEIGLPNDVPNTVFVSQSSGNDGTGTRESQALPFLTIASAISVALPLDQVIVLDGNFSETIGASDGVTLRFMPESLAQNCLFVSTNSSQVFTIYHEHAPIGNSGNATATVTVSHTNAQFFIHASVAATGTTSVAILATQGSIEMWGSATSATYFAIDCPSGSPDIKLHGNAISNGNAAISIVSGRLLVDSGGIIQALQAGVIMACNASTCIFKGVTIVAGTTFPAVVVLTVGGILPIFRNCVLVAGPSATDSISLITGTQTIKLYGQTVANKGSNPPTGVTFVGGGTYAVSASVTKDYF